jgi:hypothetical protein
VSAENA